MCQDKKQSSRLEKLHCENISENVMTRIISKQQLFSMEMQQGTEKRIDKSS